MRSQSGTDRSQRMAVAFLALPFFVVGFFWAMLAVLGLLGQADDPSTTPWSVALVVAVGFVAVAILARVVLVAGSVLVLVLRGLRRAGRMFARTTHAEMRGA